VYAKGNDIAGIVFPIMTVNVLRLKEKTEKRN